ncbi:FAD/NAD(P)-binding domain-containing protein [Myriangium duriaei CBS 260.36]|uniref:FAD/NAD(P)-binding domain-containing protein n=1 Tax=Myriangium duriaei CBS 260.36 TaxID=1168546 RepID=A0A9P4J170_9PEZI|nr:FAD/NAD(P)-binding domain-containing protein [Myriangium duriaei CBS 260.36]
MPQSLRKPILIAGGGLASLLLGQALRRASIPFLLFERDVSPSFRAQGYRLRLSAEGLDAVEAVLEKDHFVKFWDACGKTGGSGVKVINAITGGEINDGNKPSSADTVHKKQEPMPIQSRDGKTVGISRGDLRHLFMLGCESTIRWAHHVTGYELTSSGVCAIFADGTKSIEGDMLIGGEGIYSRVAKQLSDGRLKVFDTGARGIHGQAPTTAFKDLGEGVWAVTDKSNSAGPVFAITNVRSGDMDDPSIEFGWTLVAQPGVITPPNDDYTIIGEPAAKIAKSLTSEWHPRLKPLFENMNESEAAFWKITCSTPTGVPEWRNHPRVTVIGDAAHSMTPAGGLGANTAMRDAELLGRLLAQAGGYAEGITAAYEKEMRVYASETVRTSYGMASKQWNVTIDDNSPTV